MKDTFLKRLKKGLAGLPPAEVEEIVADYAAHFAGAEAEGRSEAEVADALGDPARIARELRAEIGLQRFERQWSLSNLATAAMALAGLAIVDLVFFLPLIIVAIAVAFALAVSLVAIGAAGLKIAFTALFFDQGGSISDGLGRVFIGAGLVFGCLGGGALWLMGVSAGIRALGRYARLHSRVARPGRHDT